MTRNQFVGILKERGWKLREVAELWEITAARLTQISKNPNRPAHWDYALWGLPRRHTLARVTGRRLQIARGLETPHRPSRRSTNRPQPDIFAPDTESSSGALVERGDVWAVRDGQGEHLPEGCEGFVYSIESHPNGTYAKLRFDTGYEESFEVAFLTGPDCFLSPTGRVVKLP